jgi:hypothetical protein
MSVEPIERVFDLAGVGWVFDNADPNHAIAARVLEEMRAVERQYDDSVGEHSTTGLVARITADVARYAPLVQTFATPMSVTMRTMVLCVLEGAQVRAINFAYELNKRARIEVRLELESGRQVDFVSDALWDAEVLRHFGLMQAGDAPVIDGYYAFRGATSV